MGLACAKTGILLCSCVIPLLLMAQTAGAEDVTAAIAQCAAITDSGQRLACYDGLGHHPAPKSGLGHEQLPDNPAATDQDNSLSASVTELSLTRSGQIVLVLDNGQVWQQLAGDSARFTPFGPPQNVQVMISRGLFGSYNLQFAGHNAMYKVRRVK